MGRGIENFVQRLRSFNRWLTRLDVLKRHLKVFSVKSDTNSSLINKKKKLKLVGNCFLLYGMGPQGCDT